jgi:hypothetical protein
MTGRDFSRRAWLLGSAGLLAGCETLDSIFGERRVKIVGERKPVMTLPDRTVEADAEAHAALLALHLSASLRAKRHRSPSWGTERDSQSL